MVALWHLWPSTSHWLWSSLFVTVGLVIVLIAGNILPSSSHPIVVLISPLFLEPLDASTLQGLTSRPRLVVSCLSRWGLVVTAGSHLLVVSVLARKERQAALEAAKLDAWRPISKKTRAFAAIARAIHIIIFGGFAIASGVNAVQSIKEQKILPAYCLEFTAVQFWSAMLMGAVAVLERSTRHASVALSLAPSRYIQWALQIREALQLSPHEFPIFALAMTCESIRVTNANLASLFTSSKEDGRSILAAIIAHATATIETIAFLRAVLIKNQSLLFMRWLRAPQLAQGMFLGFEQIFSMHQKYDAAICTDTQSSETSSWVSPQGNYRIKIWIYEPVISGYGEEITVDLRKAPGRWRKRGPIWTTLASQRLRVRLPGAMRELAAIDGTEIIPEIGQKCVAKAYTRETTEWLWENHGSGDEVYFRDAFAYLETSRLAAAFNQARGKEKNKSRITVTPCRVIEIIESQNQEPIQRTKNLFDLRNYLFVEPFIQGSLEHFSKFNSNAFNPRLLLNERSGHSFSDAFSHFTHHHTHGRLLVCDIQGVCRTSLQNFVSLTITDPQIHTREPCNDYGVGNGGSEDHIRAWFASHVCRSDCRLLGLSHPFSADLETGLSRVFKQLHWAPFLFRHYHENVSSAAASSSWFRSILARRFYKEHAVSPTAAKLE